MTRLRLWLVAGAAVLVLPAGCPETFSEFVHELGRNAVAALLL